MNISLMNNMFRSLNPNLKFYTKDIENFSYTQNISLGAREGTCRAIFFNLLGNKLFLVGSNNNTIYQYSLSTPWDITTMTYDNKSFSLSGQNITSASSLFFNCDGSCIFSGGYSTDKVFQYSLSTPWDISTAIYNNKFKDISGQVDGMQEIGFDKIGSKLFVLDFTTDSIYEYIMSTNWDISTAVYNDSFDFSNETAGCQGFCFNRLGTKLLVVGHIYSTASNNIVYQYSLSTPYDISSMTYDSVYLDISSQDITMRGIFLSSDGLKFYSVGTTNDNIYQYDV